VAYVTTVAANDLTHLSRSLPVVQRRRNLPVVLVLSSAAATRRTRADHRQLAVGGLQITAIPAPRTHIKTRDRSGSGSGSSSSGSVRQLP